MWLLNKLKCLNTEKEILELKWKRMLFLLFIRECRIVEITLLRNYSIVWLNIKLQREKKMFILC